MTSLIELKPYKPVEGKFVVKFKRNITPYQKGYMFKMRIGDTSGEMMLSYWGGNDRKEVEKLFNSINPDGVVHIKGESTEFRNMVSINVNPPGGFIKVVKRGEYDPAEFLPVSQRDQEEMIGELNGFAESIKNPDLKKLVFAFIRDDENIAGKFRKHPAAMYRHHGWIGGLLEHTLHVTRICDLLSKIHKELDRDIMITGAMLHDVGKMKELSVTTNIKTSTEGMMIGHLLLSLEMVNGKMEELGTPEELRLKIKHILASHHGKMEYGSPRTPATPEALCVYHADDIDSKVVYMLGRMKRASTEDDYVYTPDFGNIYLK